MNPRWDPGEDAPPRCEPVGCCLIAAFLLVFWTVAIELARSYVHWPF